MSNNTKTLWQLLNEKSDVVIPVIQRDYAQGRKDKEYIRRLFIGELKNYIDNDENIMLALDFVYGSHDEKAFMPLDGQQRLTTLWLIHWYIALRAGKLNDENIRNTLKKFTYKTRNSSNEFCQRICEIKNYDKPVELAEYIKNQSWFFSAWLQDPTISAMLRTIGGSEDSENDNIEAFFGNVDFDKCWKRLTEKATVSFELMNIGTEELPISDDLYIKMNARGKKLTDFENFKADLIGWISSDKHPDKDEFNKKVDGKITLKQYLTQCIDGKWTDLFWDETKANSEKVGYIFDGKIDEVYFEFIKRFILNRICLYPKATDMKSNDYIDKNLTEPDKKAVNKAFNILYNDDAYEGISIYQDYLTKETLESIDTIINNCKSNTNTIREALLINDYDSEENSDDNTADYYCFIPEYRIDKKNKQKKLLNKTSQKERIYFYAVCYYLKNCNQFDSEKFRKWMRICKNLIENAAIASIPDMIDVLKMISNLGERANADSWNIYSCIQNFNYTSEKTRLVEQLTEEKEKAFEIIQNENIEKIIIKAETYAFFNGTIRFLYKNKDWKNDWSSSNFETKFNSAKELFSGATVKPQTIIALLKLFDNYRDDFYFSTYGYHNRRYCWKTDILCNPNSVYRKYVHALLTKGNEEYQNSSNYKAFVDSGFIQDICKYSESYKYHYQWYNNEEAIHKDRASLSDYCMYVSDKRRAKNRILINNNDIDISINNITKNDFIWGSEIKFSFAQNNHSYNFVWLLENEDLIYRLSINETPTGSPFVWKNADENELIDGLKKLIS